jgi:opacity protein-like surface antigen
MRLKPFLGLALVMLFVCSAYSALAQSAAAATENKQSLAIGVGFSGFDPDWAGNNRLYGGTLWLDYSLKHMPSLLKGLGIEAEARDLNYGQSSLQWNMRQDTAEGGLIYSWQHYTKLHPYGKFLAGFGNTDYNGKDYNSKQNYFKDRYHDSRNFLALGGGMDYRINHSFSLRADYEYQRWPDFHVGANPHYVIDPEGITVGVLYHIGSHSTYR